MIIKIYYHIKYKLIFLNNNNNRKNNKSINEIFQVWLFQN